MDFQKLLLWRFLSAILEYKVQKFQKFTEQMMSIHLIDCDAFLEENKNEEREIFCSALL